MGFFILLSGIFFAAGNLLRADPRYTGLLGTITFVFLIVVPLLTMRLLTEDTRQRTDQLLITSPLSIAQIVLGKYLAAVAVFLITLLVTVIYPVIMSFFALLGLAWWEILGGYIGFFLLGASFIAVGLFFSSLTENQVVAVILAMGTNLLLYILSWQAYTASGLKAKVFNYLSFLQHFDELVRGILDTKDIVYFLSFSFFWLFLTHSWIQSRRWR